MIMIWSVINLIHAAQLILAIGLSSSAATRLFFWLRRSESRKTLFENGQRYQDEDGDASEESLKSFSDRWPRALFATHAFVGSLAGFGLVVIGSRNRLSIDRVVQFGIWITLMLQSMTLFTEPSAPRRFGLALRGSLNSVNVACAVLFARYNEVSQWNQLVQEERLLIIIELAAAALAGALGLLLPRRPDVFHKGVVVDRQATSSVFGLLFFSWSRSSLHVLSTTTSPLICCLPELNYRTRALHLLQQFRQHDSLQSHRYPLWRMVLGIYSRKLVVQLTLTILGSTISFAPQMMLLGILRAMERDSDRESRLSTTAPWIFGLGTSLIMTALVDKWTVWVSSIDLGLKMQKQLTMLLFDKMLRGTSTKPEEEDNDNDSEATNPASLNLINLVAVDTQQIGNCIREIYRGYESLIKLIISGYLIQQLMGWRSLVASFVMIVLLFGANALVARQLARGQNTLMADKDLRVSAVTEALLGVRRIKLSGAEDDWAKYISVQRGKELASLWAVNRWSMTSKAICTLTPIVLSVLVISIHVHATGSLKASTAFTALSILGSINGTLAAIPSLQSSWVRASNSLGRLQDYLYAADQCFPSTNHDEISFRNATVRWNGSGPTGFALKDLTLSFPPGSVSVIEGPNRSGKSLLLAAILGECELVCGNVTKPSLVAQTRAVTGGRPWPLNVAIAYVGQTPWIEAGTIMQNITFGLPMHARRYKKVLHACALETDLATFKDGDWTEIGPHGVNLSGGQRSRIALARALYSSATTLVLDDIFSAVDAHTALHMAEHVLSGSLIQGRTVILASHHPSLYMPGANFIVSLSGDGQYQCRYAEDRYQDESQDTYNTTKRMTPKERSGSSSKARSRHSRNLSTFSVASGELFVIPDSTGVMTTHQYIADEQEQNSGLQHSTLTLYLRHIGSYWYTLLIVLIYASYVGIVVGQSWWIAHWVQQNEETTQTTLVPGVNKETDLFWYLGVYAALALATCLVGVGQEYLTYASMFSASRRLFDMLLQAVLRAPMDFTDRNPLGRIMNRFTSDTAILDEQVGQVLGSALTTALTLLAIFGVGSSVSWWTLPMSLPMLLMCTYSALQFFQVARKLKHLDNISRSPILESFCSTMDGLPTIRSMLLQERYTIKFGALVDDNTRALWNLWLVNAWFGCRMALIGSIFVTTATLVIVSMPGVTVAMTGFALGFLLRYTDTVSAFVRNFINLDLALTSTSRILEYINIPSEDYSGGRLPPASWPESGRVRISDLVVRHAPHLPPALDHVSFEIGPNERVGVVGRTGAGKSTLAMAFFRILEAEQGSISLDGINIAEVALQQLRQRLSIITQDPHLFFGTVRTNLDPFGTHDDTDLLHSLEQVHWPGCRDRHGQEDDPTSGPGLFSSPNTDDVTGRNAKSMHALSLLEQPIMDGGSNLSQGQRQQLSLARAIVDRSRLLILDEATSSMDPIVDASIQKSIRELSACGFASMLVIAHRIGTVMDFDKIIVLDKGVVVESGSPGELLKLPGGYFRGLAEDARETVKEAESQEMVVETGDDMEGLFVQESTYTSASRAVETRQSVSQSVVRRQSGAHCVETRHMQR